MEYGEWVFEGTIFEWLDLTPTSPLHCWIRSFVRCIQQYCLCTQQFKWSDKNILHLNFKKPPSCSSSSFVRRVVASFFVSSSFFVFLLPLPWFVPHRRCWLLPLSALRTSPLSSCRFRRWGKASCSSLMATSSSLESI